MAETGAARVLSPDGVGLDARYSPSDDGRVSRAAVLLVHGITATMDEGGMFARLAESLAMRGVDVLRFSFRGHGESDGTSEGVTIAGEMLDLLSAYGYLAERSTAGNVIVVASSFGAVSTLLAADNLKEMQGLVMWNPVLDLDETFLHPHLQWGVENFGGKIQASLDAQGFVDVDGSFRLGPILFEEMCHYSPFEAFSKVTVPVLVIHGDRDQSVSYATSASLAEANANVNLLTVEGSDHGFDGRDKEDFAISATCDWIDERLAES